MKVNLNKGYYALRYGYPIPRKTKKALLGNRMSKSKLRTLLASVKIGKPTTTMYESSEIEPYEFCPNCGCTLMFGSGNLTAHPEHWEKFYCGRCNDIVAYIDNSPFVHALECKEENYNPVF